MCLPQYDRSSADPTLTVHCLRFNLVQIKQKRFPILHHRLFYTQLIFLWAVIVDRCSNLMEDSLLSVTMTAIVSP